MDYEIMTNEQLNKIMAERREELKAEESRPPVEMDAKTYKAGLFTTCMVCKVRIVDTWTFCPSCRDFRIYMSAEHRQKKWPMRSGTVMISPLALEGKQD